MDLSELQALRIQELAEMAKSLKISDDISGLNKQELTVKILEAQAEKDGSVFAKGILEVMHEGFGNPKYAPNPLLVNMVTAGKLGVKSGEGFYNYSEGPRNKKVASQFIK